MHEDPQYCYPGTGYRQETGKGPGQGYTMNLPFPPRSGDEEYLEALRLDPNRAETRLALAQMYENRGEHDRAIDEYRRAMALKVDSNPRACALDPYLGACLAVCEAARNLVATGAEPLKVVGAMAGG